MESGVRVVRPGEASGSITLRAEHMVIDEQMARTELLSARGELADRRWVGAHLVVRDHDAEFHRK